MTYTIYGFHDDPAHDPVVALAPEGGSLSDLLESRLRWLSDGTNVERSAYYAVIDFPDGTPGQIAPGADRVDVALGATAEDALAVLEADGDAALEEAVAAMQFLAENGRTTPTCNRRSTSTATPRASTPRSATPTGCCDLRRPPPPSPRPPRRRPNWTTRPWRTPSVAWSTSSGAGIAVLDSPGAVRGRPG